MKLWSVTPQQLELYLGWLSGLQFALLGSQFSVHGSRLGVHVWRLAFGVWRSAFGVRRLAVGGCAGGVGSRARHWTKVDLSGRSGDRGSWLPRELLG
jgi:hypothetical protein